MNKKTAERHMRRHWKIDASFPAATSTEQTKYHEKTNCTANANMLSQSGQTENKSLKTVCNNLPENLRWSLSKWWNSTTQPKHAHAERKKEENWVGEGMEERDKKESKSFTHRKKTT